MPQVAYPAAAAPDFPSFAAAREHTDDVQAQRLRWAVADLFRLGRLAEAEQLSRQAVAQHPDSEHVWVIRALICEVCHDWTGAVAALERLLQIQGDHAPAASWCQWVRVLRCDGQHERALQAAWSALQQYPAHPELSRERSQLQALQPSACPEPRRA